MSGSTPSANKHQTTSRRFFDNISNQDDEDSLSVTQELLKDYHNSLCNLFGLLRKQKK